MVGGSINMEVVTSVDSNGNVGVASSFKVLVVI
jgi:hypothetical protein